MSEQPIKFFVAFQSRGIVVQAWAKDDDQEIHFSIRQAETAGRVPDLKKGVELDILEAKGIAKGLQKWVDSQSPMTTTTISIPVACRNSIKEALGKRGQTFSGWIRKMAEKDLDV